MPSYAFSATAVAALGVLSLGCAEDSCVRNSDCDPALECRAGACVMPVVELSDADVTDGAAPVDSGTRTNDAAVGADGGGRDAGVLDADVVDSGASDAGADGDGGALDGGTGDASTSDGGDDGGSDGG